MSKNKILDGIMGLCVGDALGVPVEFTDREIRNADPVTGMRGKGTYNLPAGTWSDDTSMTLCLADSLCSGVDYLDIFTKFTAWLDEHQYTPLGKTFDCGDSTKEAIRRFKSGIDPLSCGGTSERSNGNGSLMRILPLSFYLYVKYGNDPTANDDAMKIIHNVSSLTHAHKRSLIACGIYTAVACELISGSHDISIPIKRAFDWYSGHPEFAAELEIFNNLSKSKFKKTPVDQISSSGYVVDTLEASVWCLMNTGSYKECVLKAVNLGSDTDTTAAVAGGLAGLIYGYESIPVEWLSQIARRDWVEGFCHRLDSALDG
ncbi:MAG: ADP-ribosylglycohydrolase family protein [Flexilinea sp.]